MNHAYWERNIGEVFAFVILFMLLYKGITSFFKKTLHVGLYRALMEKRFRKDVKFRRMLAPFGNHKFVHVIVVMCKYIIVSALWWLTVIGGIIKSYQYFEYATSFVLEYFNNMSYWDYHDMQVNLNGRVCLAGLIAFDIGGFLGIFIVGPLVRNMMRKLGTRKTNIVCAVLVLLFVTDMVCCSIFGPNKGEGIGKAISVIEYCRFAALLL